MHEGGILQTVVEMNLIHCMKCLLAAVLVEIEGQSGTVVNAPKTTCCALTLHANVSVLRLIIFQHAAFDICP